MNTDIDTRSNYADGTGPILGSDAKHINDDSGLPGRNVFGLLNGKKLTTEILGNTLILDKNVFYPCSSVFIRGYILDNDIQARKTYG